MAESETLAALDVQLEQLEASAGGAQVVLAAFHGELNRMQTTVVDTGRDVRVLSNGISRGLRRAIDGMVFDGMRLSEALRGVAQSMADAAYNAALRPVTQHFGGLIAEGVGALMGGMPAFADGAAFSQGRVVPFATGGVVQGPVMFPMRGATGLMGEAGPEAIMPLSRGSDGRLGVRSEGGGRPVSVVINVSTPDVESFRRSQSQISAELGRVLARGNRNR